MKIAEFYLCRQCLSSLSSLSPSLSSPSLFSPSFLSHSFPPFQYRQFTTSPNLDSNHNDEDSLVNWDDVALPNGSTDVVLARTIGSKLGLTKKEDWYSLSKSQVQKHFGSNFRYKHYVHFLKRAYPNYKWDESQFQYNRIPTRQKLLERVVRKLFPQQRIIRNARKETNYSLEIDVWLPDLRLGLEYQDPHHYVSSSRALDTLERYQHRDSLKKQILYDRGDTLIEVPCWWDGSEESLAATIHAARSDLLSNITSSPINLSPPPNFLQASTVVPDVGELMLATFLVASSEIPQVHNWWMSEKYDGVRGCWNPLRKKLYSRTGVELPCQQSFIDSLPSLSFLDGELWLGRGNFMQAARILSPTFSLSPSFSPSPSNEWAFIRYLIFDHPDPTSLHLPFESRFSSILQLFISTPSSSLSSSSSSSSTSTSLFITSQSQPPSSLLTFCETITHMRCTNTRHFTQAASQIGNQSGEGLVLRKPSHAYTSGRTQVMRKAKGARDAEAKIVAVLRDQTTSLLSPAQADAGAVYLCVMGDGVYVECTCVDAELELLVGDIVSFRYTRLHNRTGLPVLPEIYCIRHDLTWDDIIHGATSTPKKVTKWTKFGKEFKSFGFWKDASNMRDFFDEFAADNNFDPSNANNWYTVKWQKVIAAGWQAGHFTSFRRSLAEAYPDIGIDENKFYPKHPGFWQSASNVREFFMSVARQLNISNPLLPEACFDCLLDVSTEDITKAGGGSMLIHYRYSVQASLTFAFPDLLFNMESFAHKPRGYWENTENLRRFFDKFAKDNKFDPLIPDNWYPITRRQIVLAGGRLTATGESHRKAILLAYPDINIQLSKWHHLPTAYSKIRKVKPLLF